MSDNAPHPLKVKDLQALLVQQDPETEVYLEGCDCVGPSSGITALPTGGILITREEGW